MVFGISLDGESWKEGTIRTHHGHLLFRVEHSSTLYNITNYGTGLSASYNWWLLESGQVIGVGERAPLAHTIVLPTSFWFIKTTYILFGWDFQLTLISDSWYLVRWWKWGSTPSTHTTFLPASSWLIQTPHIYYHKTWAKIFSLM